MKQKKPTAGTAKKAGSKSRAKRPQAKAGGEKRTIAAKLKPDRANGSKKPEGRAAKGKPTKVARSVSAPRHLNGSNGAASANGKNGSQNGRHAVANGNGNGARTARSADVLIKVKSKQRAIKLPANYQPSDSEPFMGARQQVYFRMRLQNWKDEIVRQAKQTLQSLTEESAQHADLADRATSESDKALELRARDRQRKLIAKIDAALERLDNGSYGYCEETGEPIGLRRLDARPIATLSIEAQERHERRERVHRDD